MKKKSSTASSIILDKGEAYQNEKLNKLPGRVFFRLWARLPPAWWEQEKHKSKEEVRMGNWMIPSAGGVEVMGPL